MEWSVMNREDYEPRKALNGYFFSVLKNRDVTRASGALLLPEWVTLECFLRSGAAIMREGVGENEFEPSRNPIRDGLANL
jgi:hypothetical protein